MQDASMGDRPASKGGEVERAKLSAKFSSSESRSKKGCLVDAGAATVVTETGNGRRASEDGRGHGTLAGLDVDGTFRQPPQYVAHV